MKVTQMLFAFLFPNYLVLITVVSLLAAAIAYGLTFAYFQRTFYSLAETKYTSDVITSFVVSILTFYTVILIVFIFFECEKAKYGLKFK